MRGVGQDSFKGTVILVRRIDGSREILESPLGWRELVDYLWEVASHQDTAWVIFTSLGELEHCWIGGKMYASRNVPLASMPMQAVVARIKSLGVGR